MNVSLTPNLEKFICEKVKSGMYHSASEVIRDGLRLLIEKETLQAHRLKSLNKDIEIGLEHFSQENTISAKEAFEKISKRKVTSEESLK